MYKFICFKFKFMLRSLCLYVNDDKKTNYSTFYLRYDKHNQLTVLYATANLNLIIITINT